MWYTTARPHEYLAITGAWIETVKICKKAMIWPAQRCMRFSIQPRDYPMSLRAMTKEKLQFELPVVFTIGPDVNKRGDGTDHLETDRGDALMKYAMLLADSANKGNAGHEHIENIIKGIIEGETRVLVSAMTMEEIFVEREQFKKRIYLNIQSELDQFGLKIYNANVKELKDAPNSNYFATLSKKAHEGASNQARIDVAEAQWKGNVGEAERRGRQNREIAKIDADTAVQKTERDTEKAQAEATLATRKAAFDRDVSIAQIEATRATETRDEELLKQVEIKRAQKEVERLRASDVVKATILRESKQQAADAKAYEMEAAAKADLFRESKLADSHAYKTKIHAEASFNAASRDADAAVVREQKAADAQAYKTKVQAEAAFNAASRDADAAMVREQKAADAKAYKTRVTAEAALLAAAKDAEALLIKQTKEAEGLLIHQAKEAEGLAHMADSYAKLANAFGGPQGLIQYMMVEKGIYGQLARANADAVRGMAPKVTVWNTGSNASGGDGNSNSDPAAAIRNTYQMLPPLMSTINEQTGISLPEWQFGKLAGQLSEREHSVKEVNGTK